jgi:hypothetical protein
MKELFDALDYYRIIELILALLKGLPTDLYVVVLLVFSGGLDGS